MSSDSNFHSASSSSDIGSRDTSCIRPSVRLPLCSRRSHRASWLDHSPSQSECMALALTLDCNLHALHLFSPRPLVALQTRLQKIRLALLVVIVTVAHGAIGRDYRIYNTSSTALSISSDPSEKSKKVRGYEHPPLPLAYPLF